MNQPQPTAAEVLSDAEVIDPTTLAAKAYQEGFAHAKNDTRRASALHEDVMVQVRALERRLNAAAAPPSGQVCVDDAISLRVPDARAIRAMLQRITKGPDAKVASIYVEDLTERIDRAENGAAR